ncbi:hypothetical protein [Parapedobacter sp. 10938]|uniref:hypothetical protein n=1 Tax=Parapedobacter flavus TaxID=3110225 RepID=UPI002DB61C2B|nr:hypothetical protein [Parapedobacter sp. 10938]MEC3878657.1 hypothetical protein [Parapedobacter sp. 10938]
MRKDLKSFIQENREAFDEATPPLHLWQEIAGALDERTPQKTETRGRKRVWIMHVLKVAAVTFLVGTVGMLIYLYGKRAAYLDYSKVNPDLAAEQQIYAQLVIQKKDSIAYIAASNPALYGEFSKVIDQMESNYDVLKQEFPKSPNRELTLEAMIRNLQAQIDILSQQLDVLNDIRDSKNQTHEEQI